MTDPADFILFGPTRRLRASGVLAQLPAGSATGPAAAGHALDLLRATEARTGRRGIVVGAIPFDPARPARLIVPAEVYWEETVPESATPPGADGGPTVDAPDGADFDDRDYRAAVASVVRGIDAGLLRKVVLARTLDLRLAAPLDTAALVAELDRDNADGYTFRVDLGDGVLVGASPELLVAVDDGRLVSHPLAGTAARRDDPTADSAAAAGLATSAKDLAEHRVLVEALVSGLAAVATGLHVPSAPDLVATRRLWHLGTTVTGRIRPGLSVLDVAYAVHPTPAVCGTPTGAAADLIRMLEPVDRGFYAGLVGWMDSDGRGEWVIALRCALIGDDRDGDGADAVRLYAGAGVVAGSHPDGEHAETAAKLATMLGALSAVADIRPLRDLVGAR